MYVGSSSHVVTSSKGGIGGGGAGRGGSGGHGGGKGGGIGWVTGRRGGGEGGGGDGGGEGMSGPVGGVEGGGGEGGGKGGGGDGAGTIGMQRSPQSEQSVPCTHAVNSAPMPPSSHWPSEVHFGTCRPEPGVIQVSSQQRGGIGGGGGGGGSGGLGGGGGGRGNGGNGSGVEGGGQCAKTPAVAAEHCEAHEAMRRLIFVMSLMHGRATAGGL